MDDAIRQGRRRNRAAAERVPAVEFCGCGQPFAVEFDDRDDEIRFLLGNQIPAIAAELMLDPIDESRRSDQADRLAPMQAQPQQTVEVVKMIEMRVRYEDVTDPK